MIAGSLVSFDLGLEEMLFLLRTLGIKTLLGLDDNTPGDWAPPNLESSLSAGFNSLRARNWIRVESRAEGERVVIDSTLAALLLTCASSLQTLYMHRVPVEGSPEVSFVHFGPHLTAVHTIHEPGLHRLSGTDIAEDALAYVIATLNLDGQLAPQDIDVVVDQVNFDAVCVAVKEQGTAAAAAVLQARGMATVAASALATAVAEQRASSLVAGMCLTAAGELLSWEGFSLLESCGGFLMLDAGSDEDAAPVLRIRSVPARTCKERVEALWQHRLSS